MALSLRSSALSRRYSMERNGSMERNQSDVNLNIESRSLEGLVSSRVTDRPRRRSMSMLTSEELRSELQVFADGALKEALLDVRERLRGEIRIDFAQELRELREMSNRNTLLLRHPGEQAVSPVATSAPESREESWVAKSTGTQAYRGGVARQLRRGLTLRSFASEFSHVISDYASPAPTEAAPPPTRRAVDHPVTDDGYALLMPKTLSRETSGICQPEHRNSRHFDGTEETAIEDAEEVLRTYDVEQPEEVVKKSRKDVLLPRNVRFRVADTLLSPGRDEPQATPLPSKEDSTETDCLTGLVNSEWFENLAGIMVVLNSFLLGVEVDLSIRGITERTNRTFLFVDAFFCLFFTLEITLRILAHGCTYFSMPGWEWNLFDLSMVLLQWVDQVNQWLSALHSSWQNIGIMRALRMLTLLRVTRIFRAFHLFKDLHVIVNSMSAACESLIWSMLLQLMTIYVWGVVFMEVVSSNEEFAEDETLQYWFGSLGRSMLTMIECILSGVSWDAVVRPLMAKLSPVMGIIFVVYIAVSLFAMMNLVTGLFVTEVTNKVREDKDESLAQSIRNLFHEMGADEKDDEITRDVFLGNLRCEPMQAYLKSLDVHPSEAWRIFDILDVDGTGTLDRNEMLQGFLRLRGPARALDMSVLRREIADLGEELLSKLENPGFFSPVDPVSTRGREDSTRGDDDHPEWWMAT